MSDRSLGSLIFALGLLGMIFYVYWLIAPAETSNPLFFAPGINARWALVIPIFIAVIAVLVIAMWIGWTMVVTPPPTLIEDTGEEEIEEQEVA